MKKNDVLELEIIDNGMAFEGIARKDNMVTFVPGAIIGEQVLAKLIKVNKNYSIAKVEEILTKSRYRVDPFCEVFGKCGGCSSQHIEYDMQLILKNRLIKNVFDKQKLEYKKIENTVGMGLPYYYRNKVQYPVRENNKGETKVGFYLKRSHNVIENNCCYIQNRVIDMLAKELAEKLINAGFSGYNEEENTGDIRHILIRRGYHTKEIMICVIVNKEELIYDTKLKDIIEDLAKNNEHIKSCFINVNESNTNEILGEKLENIFGEKYISDYIGEFKYFISPKSFFQVNTLQAEVLYSILKKELNLSGNEVLFDLYSGVGSIGIFLSKEAKEIYGIEIEKEAVKMANLNLKENNVTNAEYIAGSAEEKQEEFKKRGIKPDVIVVDPPRKGLDDKSIEYILEFNPKKIGYVSCNPSTLARDLKLLSHKYEIKSVTPVDMFPHTEHVECCSVLYLKDSIQ